LSIDQRSPTAVSGTSDPFLTAMSREAARQETDEEVDSIGAGADIARAVALGALIVALLVGVVALIDGARRTDGGDLASELADMPGSLSVPVQSPFVDTTVRLVENQSAALWQQNDGSPALRLADEETGAIAALVNEDGIPVALGVIPPGLAVAPERMLISPVSTALTVAATHPDVLSTTASDSLGRLAVTARASSFSSFANLVDGSTPIAALGSPATSAAAALGSSLSSAAAQVEPDCPASEVPAPGVVRCSDTGDLQNTGLRGVPVIDTFGELCGFVPPAVFAASDAERAALVDMIVDGLPFDTAAAPGTIEPGVFNPLESCEGPGQIPTQASDQQIAEWRGQGELIDVALPLVRVIGANPSADNAALAEIQAGPLSSDLLSERLTNATIVIRDSATNSALGLDRRAQATDIQLDGLIQSTIARLYE